MGDSVRQVTGEFGFTWPFFWARSSGSAHLDLILEGMEGRQIVQVTSDHNHPREDAIFPHARVVRPLSFGNNITLEREDLGRSCPYSFPVGSPSGPEIFLEDFHRERLKNAGPLAGHFGSLLAAVFSSGSTLVAMQVLKREQGLGTLLGLSLLYFLMNTAGHVGVFLQGSLRAWVGLGTETFLAGVISRKLLRLSSSAAARQSTGNLKVLITSDVKNIGQFMDTLARSLIPSLAALVVVGPILIYFAGKSGAFGLLLMTLILPIAVVLNQISARFQKRSQGELDDLTTLTGEWIKNVRLIRYLSWDESFRKDLSQGVRKFMRMATAQHFMACLIFGVSVTWWMVAISGVLVISHLRHFPLDLTAFFGALWLLTFLAGHFHHLPGVIRQYGLAAPSVERISRFLSQPERAEEFKSDLEIADGVQPRKIIFDRVSFAFPEGPPVIRDLSMEVNLAEKLAVIGEVGAGKTTFLRLLCGEFPPTSGQVRDLWGRFTHERVRSFLAYVPQEAFVSNDLLLRNITLSEKTEGALHGAGVVEAAYWAELEADLASFSDGIHQELGEGGVNLSGGQKQRLNLARAIYSRRPYLVLDDTLSAVDTCTEAALMARLEKFEGGFVLVTHRTAELMRVGEVVVLSEGSVVEKGTPADLAADPLSALSRVFKAYEKEPAHV